MMKDTSQCENNKPFSSLCLDYQQSFKTTLPMSGEVICNREREVPYVDACEPHSDEPMRFGATEALYAVTSAGVVEEVSKPVDSNDSWGCAYDNSRARGLCPMQALFLITPKQGPSSAHQPSNDEKSMSTLSRGIISDTPVGDWIFAEPTSPAHIAAVSYFTSTTTEAFGSADVKPLPRRRAPNPSSPVHSSQPQPVVTATTGKPNTSGASSGAQPSLRRIPSATRVLSPRSLQRKGSLQDSPLGQPVLSCSPRLGMATFAQINGTSVDTQSTSAPRGGCSSASSMSTRAPLPRSGNSARSVATMTTVGTLESSIVSCGSLLTTSCARLSGILPTVNDAMDDIPLTQQLRRKGRSGMSIV